MVEPRSGLPSSVQALHEPLHHVLRHVLVDVVGQLYETEPAPRRLLARHDKYVGSIGRQ